MATQQTAYDLVLKGGTLMDPAQNINDRRDVAFKDGKVAAVSQRIDPTEAAQVVDVTGKLVTPGFIDLHCHFYDGSAVCIDADKVCPSGGVTTAVRRRQRRLDQLQDNARLHRTHQGDPGAGLPTYWGHRAPPEPGRGR